MRIAVPHHTTRENARRIVEQKLGDLMKSYGSYADHSEHSWSGDTLSFKGKARGFTVEGKVEVTDSEVILDGKLPLLAKPFEPRIRHTVEQEAAKIFKA